MKKNIKNIISVAFSHSISISLFKSENRDSFIKVYPTEESFAIQFDEGIP